MSVSMSPQHPAEVDQRPTISAFHKVKLAFLAAAFFSFVLSVVLWFAVDRELGLFVGLWVPAIHSLGTLVLTGEEETS